MIHHPVDRMPYATEGEFIVLVLTRKLGQSIVINDNIEVIVLEVRGEQVRIGIKAPKTVTVHRKEIYDQIHEPEADGVVKPDAE
jgi:carbon storage regulator